MRPNAYTYDRLSEGHANKAAPQAALIQALAPTIRGWSQYYATVASSRTFAAMDRRVFQSLRRWALRRHPRKSRHWCMAKYSRLERGRWDFGPPGGPTLVKHRAAHHRQHVKVQGARSTFDGDWVYWSTRLGRHLEVPRRVARLLQRQRGRCARCTLFFRDGDLPEIDHVIPRRLGGSDRYANQLAASPSALPRSEDGGICRHDIHDHGPDH